MGFIYENRFFRTIASSSVLHESSSFGNQGFECQRTYIEDCWSLSSGKKRGYPASFWSLELLRPPTGTHNFPSVPPVLFSTASFSHSVSTPGFVFYNHKLEGTDSAILYETTSFPPLRCQGTTFVLFFPAQPILPLKIVPQAIQRKWMYHQILRALILSHPRRPPTDQQKSRLISRRREEYRPR